MNLDTEGKDMELYLILQIIATKRNITSFTIIYWYKSISIKGSAKL